MLAQIKTDVQLHAIQLLLCTLENGRNMHWFCVLPAIRYLENNVVFIADRIA